MIRILMITVVMVTLLVMHNLFFGQQKTDKHEEKDNLQYKTRSIEDNHEIKDNIKIIELQDDTDWTTEDMWEMLGCDEIFEKERPIHSQAVWNKLRLVYQKIVDKDSSIKTNNTQHGSRFPVKVKQVPSKGRGIFAVKDISAGELIWSTTKTARFRDGPSYRQFLFNIEKGEACDVLQWGKPTLFLVSSFILEQFTEESYL